MVLAVPSNSPFRSITDLVKAAASRPRSLNFASLGNGTASHLAAEMFKTQANVDLVHVPYRSVPQTLAALMVGEIDVFFDVPSILTHVTAGKLKALAVTGRTRTALAPWLPTLAESGFPDFEMIAWYGVFAPAGLSPERQAKLHADIVRVLADPEVKVKLNAIGFEIVGNTSEQFAAHIKSESARWAALIRATGLRAE